MLTIAVEAVVKLAALLAVGALALWWLLSASLLGTGALWAAQRYAQRAPA